MNIANDYWVSPRMCNQHNYLFLGVVCNLSNVVQNLIQKDFRITLMIETNFAIIDILYILIVRYMELILDIQVH